MHLAVLGCRGIPARYGGFETFAEQLATRLVQRGFRVTVYAEAHAIGRPDEIFRGVTVRYRWRPRWLGQGVATMFYDVSCIWDARRRYGVVYMLGYGAAWACGLPRLFGTKVWINPDGLEWARAKWGRAIRRYFHFMEWMTSRVASLVVADAQTIADRFLSLYPRGAAVTYIPYGAVIPEAAPDRVADRLQQHGLTPQDYFLVVARLEPENQLHEIVRAFEVYSGSTPLVIVGGLSNGNPYHGRLLCAASSRIRFLGAIYDPELLQALRVGSKAYVHGHSVGGTNPSLLEAMACGNIVIAHDNPFNREVLGDSALYFSGAADLAANLAEVDAMGSEVRRQRSSEFQQNVARRFNWDRVTDLYSQELLKTQS